MKNQSFQAAGRLENSRKLDVTLRKFTNDRLTEEQRRLIGSALSHRSQHRVQVFQTAEAFCRLVKESASSAKVRMLFGCLETCENAPAAALICQPGPRKPTNAVYIYLPTETEEERDEPR